MKITARRGFSSIVIVSTLALLIVGPLIVYYFVKNNRPNAADNSLNTSTSMTIPTVNESYLVDARTRQYYLNIVGEAVFDITVYSKNPFSQLRAEFSVDNGFVDSRLVQDQVRISDNSAYPYTNKYEIKFNTLNQKDGRHEFKLILSENDKYLTEDVNTYEAANDKDLDQDGYIGRQELAVGTLYQQNCYKNAWPPDFNDDGIVTSGDQLLMAKQISSLQTNTRYDINFDGAVNSGDQLTLANLVGKSCRKFATKTMTINAVRGTDGHSKLDIKVSPQVEKSQILTIFKGSKCGTFNSNGYEGGIAYSNFYSYLSEVTLNNVNVGETYCAELFKDDAYLGIIDSNRVVFTIK